MDDFFRAARTTTGFEGELIAVDDDTLLAHDLHYWAGPRSLPLWLPIADVGFVRRDGTSFLATGGLRPLEDTLLRTLTDEVERGVGRPRRSGITTSEEQEVLDAVR